MGQIQDGVVCGFHLFLAHFSCLFKLGAIYHTSTLRNAKKSTNQWILVGSKLRKDATGRCFTGEFRPIRMIGVTLLVQCGCSGTGFWNLCGFFM